MWVLGTDLRSSQLQGRHLFYWAAWKLMCLRCVLGQCCKLIVKCPPQEPMLKVGPQLVELIWEARKPFIIWPT